MRSRISASGGSSSSVASREVEISSKALRTEEKVWRGGRVGEASIVSREEITLRRRSRWRRGDGWREREMVRGGDVGRGD